MPSAWKSFDPEELERFVDNYKPFDFNFKQIRLK